MNILVVYESSYGNTHLIADAVAEGLVACDEVVRRKSTQRSGLTAFVRQDLGATPLVVPVAQAAKELVERADLLVVGGPTHAHGMSREQTRQAAVQATHKPGSPLHLDPDAEGAGLRDWFGTFGPIAAHAAAFDTRLDASPLLTGRASKGISRQLGRHGCREIVEPMSFLVTKDNVLVDGQLAAAHRWGELLASTMTAAGVGAGRRSDCPDR